MNPKKPINEQLDLMIKYLERKRDSLKPPAPSIIETMIKYLRTEMNEKAEKVKYDYDEWIEGCAYPEYWEEKSKEEFQEQRMEWIEDSIEICKGIKWIIKASSLIEHMVWEEMRGDLKYYDSKMEQFKELKDKIKEER